MNRLPFVLLPEAQADFDEAYDWHERQRAGGGDRFADAVRQTIDFITAFPLAGRLKYRDARKRLVPRFRYMVVYRIVGQVGHVVAVSHTSRDPQVWQSRVDASDQP